MKTFQEYYKDFISTTQGRQRFNQICDELIEELSFGFDTTEYARDTLAALIERLNTAEIPANDDVLIGYFMVPPDGYDLYCTMLYSKEKILSLPQIKPWDDIAFGDKDKKGDISFSELNDLIITTRLSCYHMLPRNYRWASESIDYVLGAGAFPDFFEFCFLKSVLEDILSTQLYDVPHDDFPLTYVDDEIIPMPKKKEEDCDYIDEDARDSWSKDIRRTQLLSFLNLYHELQDVKKALIEEER